MVLAESNTFRILKRNSLPSFVGSFDGRKDGSAVGWEVVGLKVSP